MVRKRIEELTGNEIAAEDIKNDKGFLIIPKESLIKKEYLSLLQEIGIESICIQQNNDARKQNDIILESCEEIQKLLEMHVCGIENSLRNVEKMAEKLWREVSFEKTELSSVGRSKSIYEHTICVTVLVILISKELNRKFEECQELIVGSLLHDIGLRYISMPFMNKNICDMTPEELFEFKSHTVLGYTALENEKFSKQIKELVLFHHERKDGSGYPLKKKNLGTEFQILQCANMYDCMLVGLGREADTQADIISYFTSIKNVDFDEDLVEALLKVIVR